MTLPLLPIGDDWQNQLAFWSPGTNTTKTPQTVWIYYGGAWFDPSVYTPDSPVKDFYSGYHIDLNGSPTSDTGVYVNSSKVTALLIAPDYRWVEGWDSDPNRIEAPLTRYFDGDDLISGRNSRTQVFSGPGDDTLYLNGGNDWGLGGDGDDVIHGGAGNDLIYGDWTNVPVYVDPAYGPNTDQFFSNASHANRLIWSFEIPAENSPARTKHFDEDGNLVDGEPVGDDLLFGDQGSDTLYGGPGNDQLDGGPRGSGWTDVLYGGDGADMFYLNYETESESEEEPEKWWVEWGEEAVGEAGAKSTSKIVKALAEAAAEDFFETMVGGVLLGGVAGAISSSVAFGIEALFKKSKPEAPPVTSEDVMIVADFDPRVDALYLPMDDGKTLTAEATYFASSPSGQTGWGATFSTIDGVYAEVFLSQAFLDEFGVSSNTPGAKAFIDNLFTTAMVVDENGLADEGGVSGEDAAYPFQNLTAADYTDGVIPEYADTTPLALATPEGTEATIFGAIAPLKVFGPEVNNAVAMVAGTNMGDILSVNTKGFAPWNYRSSSVQLFEGPSLVKGFGGDDIIFGGAGQDILHGGDGDDDLYSFQTAITSSGPLRESLYGEDGDDALYTGGTAADLYGGNGTDTVSFAISPYAVAASLADAVGADIDQPGNTYKFNGIENLEGSVQGDQLTGDANNNVISGLAGDDALTGAAGNDTITGGDGYDTVRFASGTTGGILVDLAYNFGDGRGSVGLWRDAYGGSDTVDRASVEAYAGTPNDDEFKGDGGNGTNPLYSADFFGRGGNDTLTGSGLAQTLDGGDGDDLLQGVGGTDTLTGGDGSDIFAGTPNDIDGDVIEDFTVDDVLRVLNPGTYPTSYAFRVNMVENTATQTVLAITEADGKTVLAELTLEGNFNGRFNGHYFKVTNGSTYTDISYSPPSGATITGGTGADQLSGTIGHDLLRGGKGADWMSGGEGDDIAIGGKGADFIRGEDGNDLLRGGKGADRIYGGEGDDMIFGGKGADRIVGHSGANDLWGGTGADVFVFEAGQDLNIVHDFEVGHDKVEILAAGRAVQVDLAIAPGSTTVLLDGVGPIVLLEGVTATIDDFRFV